MMRSFMLAACGLLLMAGLPALAQQAEDFGDYLIHYNTLNSNLLPADVARAYGIQRAGTRALLNITVMRKKDDDLDEPVKARVEATATNLAGQRRDLEMREVVEQEAIYYIATLPIRDEETLNFRVRVQPEGATGPAREFSFQQKFYIEQPRG